MRATPQARLTAGTTRAGTTASAEGPRLVTLPGLSAVKGKGEIVTYFPVGKNQ
jgi:hypothetical protein